MKLKNAVGSLRLSSFLQGFFALAKKAFELRSTAPQAVRMPGYPTTPSKEKIGIELVKT